MSYEFVKLTLEASKAFQKDIDELWLPPTESLPSHKEKVLPLALVRGTRGYIEIVVNQINGTYECACYDACAVMIRRLIETLIIETFEQNNIADHIKNQSNDFLPLSDLIGNMLKETSWNLSRNTTKALQSLPKLKGIGDLSAHNRRYNALRHDIDKVIPDLRTIVQELIYLAKFK